ncbi:hypothetical protein QP794_27080 [Paenibacillus sp. UMB7766-LJ446]|uniref:hypothetical protein n=1 Tax=Paenibacillus sp. UMB7766-LJ446 TaxID=3046313 RepID=UPI00254E41DA|nr:hypothetical protein [Paenibacillus sp. UMB7766-LJ446]MDK8193752.1 hypothetical protein [Paenibacillus sp. UMB7766-LJ446]
MSWVRMNIFNDQLSGELEMDQLGAGDISAVVAGFFGAFGLKESKRESTAPVVTVAPYYNHSSPSVPSAPLSQSQQLFSELPAKVMASTIEGKQAVKEILKDAVKENAKRVTKPAMINSDRTMSTSLGEKLAEAYQKIDPDSLNAISNSTETNEQVEDYMVTGIKHKDGVAHYKCRYWCKNPKCRGKGNHYILPEEKTVECYDCGSVHEVREAVHAQPLQRDDWGNFFVADHLS